MKEYYVYILASESKTIYVWVTKDLKRRIFEHKEKIIEWFISKYNCEKLVYYEFFRYKRSNCLWKKIEKL